MIAVNESIRLSEFRESDKPTLVEWLNDRNIYERTLRVPYPYTAADADEWLALTARLANEKRSFHWAIRDADDLLIGGCGFEGIQPGKSHRAEIGYWLAAPYWGSGIMTAVVQRLCQVAFDDLGLTKITAHVFTHNPASARVLEKCGFSQEGLLRQHVLKDGQPIDVCVFGLLK